MNCYLLPHTVMNAQKKRKDAENIVVVIIISSMNISKTIANFTKKKNDLIQYIVLEELDSFANIM